MGLFSGLDCICSVMGVGVCLQLKSLECFWTLLVLYGSSQRALPPSTRNQDYIILHERSASLVVAELDCFPNETARTILGKNHLPMQVHSSSLVRRTNSSYLCSSISYLIPRSRYPINRFLPSVHSSSIYSKSAGSASSALDRIFPHNE